MFKITGILEYIALIPLILVALTVHECAHGYVSYLLGDPTAKYMGRLTFNPLKHIDPMGALMMLFFRFGWAKPVPISPKYYKHRRLGTILVSLAGPVANLMLATVLAVIYALIIKFSNASVPAFVFDFMSDFMVLNLGLFVFNLIPIPPLDGSKVLISLLPQKAEYFFYKYEQMGMFILLFLIWFDLITPILLWGVENVLALLIELIYLIVGI